MLFRLFFLLLSLFGLSLCRADFRKEFDIHSKQAKAHIQDEFAHLDPEHKLFTEDVSKMSEDVFNTFNSFLIILTFIKII